MGDPVRNSVSDYYHSEAAKVSRTKSVYLHAVITERAPPGVARVAAVEFVRLLHVSPTLHY